MNREFIKNFEVSTNVYRTKCYVVFQDIAVCKDENGETVLVSNDTYYKRSVVRDFYYLSKYKNRKAINGKRLSTNSYTRKYID